MMIDVTGPDGDTVAVDVDLTMASMTLQELARVEEAIGADRYDRLVDGHGTRSPAVLRALVWTKVYSVRPCRIDEFDLDLGVLAGLVADDETPRPPIDMTGPDGVTITAEANGGKAQAGSEPASSP